MITVVLVEDAPAVLRALRESLSRDTGVRIIGEATSLKCGLTLAARLEPDIVVVDAEITGLDGPRSLVAARKRVPESALLVLTLEPDRVAGFQAIDVVGKLDRVGALLDKIRAIGRRRQVERTGT